MLGNTTSIDTSVHDAAVHDAAVHDAAVGNTSVSDVVGGNTAEGTARTILRQRRGRRLFGRRTSEDDVRPILPPESERPAPDIDDRSALPEISEVPVPMPTTRPVEVSEQAHGDDGPIAADGAYSWRTAAAPPEVTPTFDETAAPGPVSLPASLAERFPPVPRSAAALPPGAPLVPAPPVPAPPLPAPPVPEPPPAVAPQSAPAAQDPPTQLVAVHAEFARTATSFQSMLAAHQAEMSRLTVEMTALRTAMTSMNVPTANAPAAAPTSPLTTELVTTPATTTALVTTPAATNPAATNPAATAPAATVEDLPRQRATRGVTLEVDAAAAVAAAAARIGLPPAHVDVLQQWVAHDGRAVIEVAHAGGRHRIGLAAIVYAVSTGRQVLVVVPNRESADSWRASLAVHAPEVEVLIDGGGRRDPAAPSPHVVLSTAATTARRITAGFEPAALLVAIDAERFSTALLAKALDERCEWRLGLSESFRSGGRRLARYAEEYFGGTVLTIS